MKDLYLQLWEAFSDIYFDEKPHKYTDSVGTDYTSVTTFLKRFESEKDTRQMAELALKSGKHPEYQGKTIDEILEMWKATTEYACEIGTIVHATLEYGWQNKEYYPDERLFEKYPEMREDYLYRKEKCQYILKLLKERYIPIKTETIVYDRAWKLCGTIDFLAYNKKTDQIAIFDWKTNKKWSFANKFQKLNKPFDFMDDCNINHYELQLNTYKAILEKHTDIKVGEMRLIHIPNMEKAVIETHECRDLQKILIPYLENQCN